MSFCLGLLSYRGMTFTWDGRKLAAAVNGTKNISYTYNENGIRTSKTVGETTTEYFLDGSTVAAQKTGNDVLWFLYDADGQRLGFTYNGTPYLYIYNGTGDVVGIVDDTLATVVEYTYSPWGEILSVDGGGANTIGALNPFRYRGYYFDEETGLYYLNARYYDPEVGRFISADAFLDQGSLLGNNLFAYCFNNPVNNSDTTGNFVITAAVVATIGKVAVTALTITMAALLVSPAGQQAIQSLGDGLAAIGSTVTSAVETITGPVTIRDQSVYIMRDKTSGKVKYVGRTNDPDRRQKEHDRDPKKDHLNPLEVKFSGLTVAEAKAMEQVLISGYTLEYLDNARREIAKKNVSGFQSEIGNIVSLFQGLTEDELLNLMGR